MLCLVKFPDQISAKNETIYRHSAKIVFEKLSLLEKKINKVIAVGSSDYQSLWPGEYWTTSKALNKNLTGTTSGYTLVVGLDAPLLSLDTMHNFIEACSINIEAGNSMPFCTFRETPPQKNPASLELGGIVLCVVSQAPGKLNISIATDSENTLSAAQNISFDFSENELSVRSKKNIHVNCLMAENNYPQNQKDTNQDSQQGIYYSKNKHTVRIKIANCCNMTVSELLETPSLYSKIHYSLPPLTIDGLIGTTERQTRINLQSGEEIHGRQAFPKVYEPFLGMKFVCKSIIHDFLLRDALPGKSEKFMPFLVKATESKLISEDALYITSSFSSKAHPTAFS